MGTIKNIIIDAYGPNSSEGLYRFSISKQTFLIACLLKFFSSNL